MGFKTTFRFSNLSKLERAFKAGTRQGLQISSIKLAGEPSIPNSGLIKQEMHKPKTGRIYTISNKAGKRLHRSSNASGLESSAILTGKLERSIRGKVKGSSRLEISANTPYAALQEKGGQNGVGAYVAPRNNLKRPIEGSRRDIRNNLDNSIRVILK
tara:strand:+ start:9899 stop:10369 length:471 start_codon:yes stop_codon:yes gene_type:complete